jgi:hypothetical protein
MNTLGALALLLSTANGLEAIPSSELETIGASIAFEEGSCVFWTGDNGMDAKQFRTDLERFAPREHLVIYYSSDVPKRCVNAARRAGRGTGFKVVSIKEDNELAGPVGPPMPGN